MQKATGFFGAVANAVFLIRERVIVSAQPLTGYLIFLILYIVQFLLIIFAVFCNMFGRKDYIHTQN